MYKMKAPVLLLIIGMILSFSCCRESAENNSGILQEEAGIIEKEIGAIHEKHTRFKEAERNGKLQKQLDLKREIDGLISRTNNSLRDCSEKENSDKSIPFRQEENRGIFEVKEVKLVGCRFNEEIMDVQIQLIAVAIAKENDNVSLNGEVLNNSNQLLKRINFNMANDFPQKGKTVHLIAHIEGSALLKYFSKIRFN